MKSVLLAALLAAPGCAVVAVPALAADATTLDPVVVTATRTPELQSQTLASTIVIDRQQIEQMQPNDLADLLRFNAGIDIARNGGPGQVTSVFIRGGDSNHTLVLIDGVRVNPGTAGGAALQNISPDLIERIEIVKGPLSTLYGSDAIAGVINVITRKPTPDEHINASIGGGRYGTVDEAASYSNSIGRYGFVAQTEQQSSDGLPTCVDAADRAKFRNNTMTLKGTADFDVVTVEARAWNAQGKTDYLDFCGPFGENPTAQNYRNQVLALAATAHLLPIWDSTLTASRGEDRIRQYAGDDSATPPDADFVRTLRPGLDWQNTLRLGSDFRVVAGAEGYQERVDSLSFGSRIAENTEVYRGYLQGQFDHGRNHALLAGSALHHSTFGSRETYNAEYGFDVLTDAAYRTTLIASTGTGFRAPDASDRYGFGGNPDLRPERARNYEVGIRTLFGRTQSVELRAFRNSITDLINVEYSAANDQDVDFGYKAVNVDRARNEGLELTYAYTDGLWSGRLTGIAQNPIDESDGSLLARRARNTVNASLTRQLGRFFVGVDTLATSQRTDVDAASGAPTIDGGYVLVNLDAGVRLDRRWQLSLRLENALDRDYALASGYSTMGRAVYGTLRLAL
jgi:vitamin B12 transporter